MSCFVICCGANVWAQSSGQPLSSSKCNEFTFDATGSYDQEGGKLRYEWNLGDGTIVNDPVVEHTYERAGIYTVTLTITDEEGLSSHSSQKVQANIAPKVTLIAPEAICSNQPLMMDATATFDDSQRKLRFIWDFGDGTTTQNKPNVTKTYVKGGNYKVRLTADDGSGVLCSSKTIERIIRVNEPPIADAGAERIQQCISGEEDYTVAFDAKTTYDINGDTLTYRWDFGDLSEIAEGEQVTHRYKELGVYDVKLVVDDNSDLGCGSAIDYVKVQINEAPKAEAGGDIVACSGDEVYFDGSSSHANPPGTLVAKWEFGDGLSANGLNVHHTYTKAGDYKALLRIESALNASCPATSDIKNVSINSSPSVEFKAPSSGCVGEEIAFDASSAKDPDGDALEYYWSFGDGMILRGEAKATHRYEIGGTYQASVIVDDKKGTSCSTATITKPILINTPPKASAGVNQSCCVDVAATFDGSATMDADNDKLTYTWDFGDGTNASGAIVSHTYKRNGTFKVTLKVDDNSGTSCSQATDSLTTEINTTPVPVINIR